MDKVVYRFDDDDGNAVAIGQGKKERFDTLERIRKYGKIVSANHNKTPYIFLHRHKMTKPGILLYENLTSEEARKKETELHKEYGGNMGDCRPLMEKRLNEVNITDPVYRWIFMSWAKHGDGLCFGRMDGMGNKDKHEIPEGVKEVIIKVLGDVF